MSRFVYILSLVCLNYALYAAPIGNPAAPRILGIGLFIPQDSSLGVRAGYLGDFVYDGRMRQSSLGHGRVDRVTQITNSGKLTLNFLHRLDFYGLLGTSQLKADWRFDQGILVRRVDLHTHTGFLWTAGSQVILYEWGGLDLGLGGSYSGFTADPSWMTVDGESLVVTATHYKWRQWQANLGLSYRIDFFIPYLGVNYAKARSRVSHFSEPISASLQGNNEFKNRNPWGFFVGCSLSNGKYFMLNLEGRLVDEEAFSISGEFGF